MTDVTDADVGKPIFSGDEKEIGTLREIDYPTLYFEFSDDVDDELRSNMKVAETTHKRYGDDAKVLASAPLGAVKDITDDGIRLWPSYATESHKAQHESVDYGEIPQKGGHSEGGQK